MSEKKGAAAISSNEIRTARKIVREIISRTMPPSGTQTSQGRGIVTCGGGYTYFANAWILIRMLRHLGCQLPIQLWHLGADEISAEMKRLVARFGVECIDGGSLVRESLRNGNSSNGGPPGSNGHGANGNGTKAGWILKSLAVARCPFEEVLFLDADNLPVRDPSFLFDIPEYRSAGAIFWPGIRYTSNKSPLWKIFELPFTEEPEVESGQMVINKPACREALNLVEHLNFHSKMFYPLAYGGKDLFRFAWRRAAKAYASPEFSPQMLTVPDTRGEATDAALCQHDFNGERIFQHRLFRKWDLLGENPWVPGFFFESQCHDFLNELKSRWNGRCITTTNRARAAGLRTLQQSLVNNVWLLEVPGPLPENSAGEPADELDEEPPQESHLPDFVKAPEHVGKINVEDASLIPVGPDAGQALKSRPPSIRELKFGQDGTIKSGSSSQVGYHWDFDQRSNQLKLHLSSGVQVMMRFKRINENYWKGRCLNGAAAGRTAKLRAIPDVYPHLAAEFGAKMSAAEKRKVLSSLGKSVRVKCSAPDMGDHIAAAYACVGLSRLGVSVTFHSSHAPWLARLAEPGLVVTRDRPDPSVHDLNFQKENQLRYGKSRASWYAATLHPLLKPQRPVIGRTEIKRRFPFDRYIILAPFTRTKGTDRYWPEAHWTRLTNLIREEGYEIVAIGMENQAAQLLRTFSQTQAYWSVGNPPEWVMDALAGAAAYIGIDNDVTHLAALLQVKALAIHSQLPAAFLWPEGSVQSVTPESSCTFCRWQKEGGYLASCDSACSALATISPETVRKALLKLVRK